MAHKSPFDQRIYDEWEILISYTEPLQQEEKERHWRKLYDSCFTGEAWAVGIDDAGLVAYLGVQLALQGKRYTQAIHIALEYLDHPDIGNKNAAWDEMRTWLGFARILAGEMDGGIALLDQVIQAGRHPAQTRRHIVRNEFLSFLATVGPEAMADEAVKALASRLLVGWRGQKRKARIALAVTTNNELGDLLYSTYPNKPSRAASQTSEN
jgi:hypothetical protein